MFRRPQKSYSDWPSLRAAAFQYPRTGIVKKHGGFVIKESGVIVVACDEKLSVETEAHSEQLEWIREDLAGQTEA
jgi:hypothetical protein